MKTIWIMRHAKSDWSDESLADVDRPLNKRGRADAPRMGRWLARRDSPPDRIASSPARRARDTAELVGRALGLPSGRIEWRADFYPGDPAAVLAFLRGLPDGVRHVLLIGHNPGWEELVGVLCSGSAAGLRLTTAAVALLRADVDRWADLGTGRAELEGLMTPKLLPE